MIFCFPSRGSIEIDISLKICSLTRNSARKWALPAAKKCNDPKKKADLRPGTWTWAGSAASAAHLGEECKKWISRSWNTDCSGEMSFFTWFMKYDHYIPCTYVKHGNETAFQNFVWLTPWVVHGHFYPFERRGEEGRKNLGHDWNQFVKTYFSKLLLFATQMLGEGVIK